MEARIASSFAVNQRSGSGRKTAKMAIGCANSYRRLTVLLKREGWKVQRQRIYRLYDEENLKVRSTDRKKTALGSGVAARRRTSAVVVAPGSLTKLGKWPREIREASPSVVEIVDSRRTN